MAITDKMIESELLGDDTKKKESWSDNLMKKINNIFAKKNKKKKSWVDYDKNQFKILVSVAGVLLLACIVYGIYVFSIVGEANEKTEELNLLSTYDTATLENIEGIDDFGNLDSLLEKNSEIENEIIGYNQYFEQLNAPYANFMSNIYLPSINVWEDAYTNELDLSIVGQKFIERNPYEDITLIQNWSDFFTDVGDNIESNIISNISVWDREETEDGLFKIPLNIEFVSPSKRSFLLLINKLSITSNVQNISLINEFVYFLREEIKAQKQDEIEQMKDDPIFSGWNEDKIIWYDLYQWVSWESETSLIDESVVGSTIANSASCQENQNEDECLYNFREKFISLPNLAYQVWMRDNRNRTEDLKDFLSDIPVVIALTNFSFDPVEDENKVNGESTKYAGTINIDIYGKWMSASSLERISQTLWENCLGESLTPASALARLEDSIIQLWNINTINTQQSQYLWELKDILTNIQTTYAELSNYEKVIKLIEIDRMLDGWNLCKVS